MSDALKRCPFCGSHNILSYSTNEGGERVHYEQCNDCTACGPDHKNGLHWNRRATPTAEAAQTEQYFRDAPSPPDAPPRAEAAESGADRPDCPNWNTPGMCYRVRCQLGGTCIGRPDMRGSAPASDGDLVARFLMKTRYPSFADVPEVVNATIKQINANLDELQSAIERLTLERDTQRDITDREVARALAAEAKLDAAMRVVAELVACKDLLQTVRDCNIAAVDHAGYELVDKLKAEYDRRLPLSWDAARALIAESGSKT